MQPLVECINCSKEWHNIAAIPLRKDLPHIGILGHQDLEITLTFKKGGMPEDVLLFDPDDIPGSYSKLHVCV